MRRIYLFRLFIRLAIFLWAGWLYFVEPAALDIGRLAFFSEISKAHIIWACLLIGMLLPHIPNAKVSLGCLKQHKKYYWPDEPVDRLGLAQYIRTSDRRALIIGILWVVSNALLWILYWVKWIDAAGLLLVVLFFSVCDLICVLFICPFQWIMKNRCCVTCRIFSWDHLMMVMPLIPVKGFFSYSLYLTALILLIIWERVWRRSPERYWSGSNRALRCKSCKAPLCQWKKTDRTRA